MRVIGGPYGQSAGSDALHDNRFGSIALIAGHLGVLGPISCLGAAIGHLNVLPIKTCPLGQVKFVFREGTE